MNGVNKKTDIGDITNIDASDVLCVINRYIKYKSSARKSYMRLKVLAKDTKCDITQLIYQLYNAIENKKIVINDTQENITMKKENFKLMKEIEELKIYKEKYENSNRHNLQKRKLLDEKEDEIVKLNMINSQLKAQLESKEIKDVKKSEGSVEVIERSVFDGPLEIIEVKEEEDNYYNTPIEYGTQNLDEYSNEDIQLVKGQIGFEKWDNMSPDKKKKIMDGFII